jgi:hypothetical protein
VHAWRLTVALRQVLHRAVAWELLDYDPAKRGVSNPQRRAKEKRPFENWRQVETVAAQLGPVYRPKVIFAAATRLRPTRRAFKSQDRAMRIGAPADDTLLSTTRRREWATK